MVGKFLKSYLPLTKYKDQKLASRAQLRYFQEDLIFQVCGDFRMRKKWKYLTL